MSKDTQLTRGRTNMQIHWSSPRLMLLSIASLLLLLASPQAFRRRASEVWITAVATNCGCKPNSEREESSGKNVEWAHACVSAPSWKGGNVVVKITKEYIHKDNKRRSDSRRDISARSRSQRVGGRMIHHHTGQAKLSSLSSTWRTLGVPEWRPWGLGKVGQREKLKIELSESFYAE